MACLTNAPSLYMAAVIVSDNHSLAVRLQAILQRQGQNCPNSNLISSDNAASLLSRKGNAIDLIFVVGSTDAHTTLRQIRRLTGAQIVALGPTEDPQQIIRSMHAGATDYVDEQSNLDVELPALLKRIAENVSGSRPPGQVISIISAAGGSGKSIVACNLAVAIASLTGRASLLDLHSTSGAQAILLNLKARHTIVDLFRNARSLDQSMIEQSLVRHETGVHLLAAGMSTEPIEPVEAQAIDSIMQFACGRFPYAIVDVENTHGKSMLRCLTLSNTICFVLRLDFVSLVKARLRIEYLEQHVVKRGTIRLIANRVGQTNEVPIAKAEEALGRKIDFCVPEDSSAANLSVNYGVPMVIEQPNAKASVSLLAIARDLAGWDNDAQRAKVADVARFPRRAAALLKVFGVT